MVKTTDKFRALVGFLASNLPERMTIGWREMAEGMFQNLESPVENLEAWAEYIHKGWWYAHGRLAPALLAQGCLTFPIADLNPFPEEHPHYRREIIIFPYFPEEQIIRVWAAVDKMVIYEDGPSACHKKAEGLRLVKPGDLVFESHFTRLQAWSKKCLANDQNLLDAAASLEGISLEQYERLNGVLAARPQIQTSKYKVNGGGKMKPFAGSEGSPAW